jgi:hypothetical protein
MNNIIEKARPAKKHTTQTSGEPRKFQNGLAKVEGILTSPIQTKRDTQEPNNQ